VAKRKQLAVGSDSAKPKRKHKQRTPEQERARRTGCPPGRPPALHPSQTITKSDNAKPVNIVKFIRNLAALHCTEKEITSVLEVHKSTFIAFKKKYPEVKTALEAGVDEGKVSLRRSQFKLAERNATMAIFLGMQYLGQKDLRQQWAWNPNLGGKESEAENTIRIVVTGGMPDAKTLEEQAAILSLPGQHAPPIFERKPQVAEIVEPAARDKENAG
jgi:hypothetical protein